MTTCKRGHSHWTVRGARWCDAEEQLSLIETTSLANLRFTARYATIDSYTCLVCGALVKLPLLAQHRVKCGVA